MADILKVNLGRIVTAFAIIAAICGALLWVTPLLSNAMTYREDKTALQRVLNDHEARLIKVEEARVNMMDTIKRVEANTERIIDRLDRHIMNDPK